mmetsp:Transcript_25018/g.42293  ORF Transcript_25018/g.42293 Transcript_25018/m.42293 type:complete len:278 (-) Transcript_25018:233-1066(-)
MDRTTSEKTLHCVDLEEGVRSFECISGNHGNTCASKVINPPNDGRLFDDEALYCEGHHKPLLRGIMHLVCSLMLPTVLYLFIQASRGSPKAIIASTLYLTSNMFCYGVSGIYHVFDWSPKVEILLQKLDHCGITILSVGTIVPDALLLLPLLPYGLPMLVVSGGLCAYACFRIMSGKASMKWQMVVAVWWVIPYLLPNYMLMTSTEFCAMACTCLFQLVGAVIFAARCPDPHSPCCGYHEVFHLFVVLAGISVIACNYSIVKRHGDAYWVDNHTIRD